MKKLKELIRNNYFMELEMQIRYLSLRIYIIYENTSLIFAKFSKKTVLVKKNCATKHIELVMTDHRRP